VYAFPFFRTVRVLDFLGKRLVVRVESQSPFVLVDRLVIVAVLVIRVALFHLRTNLILARSLDLALKNVSKKK